MLEKLVEEYEPSYLMTYTRNPAIIKMLQKQSSEVYPLDKDEQLKQMALAMNYSVERDAVYHIDRYAEEGLFRGEDPANSPVDESGESLKQKFTSLMSVRNALIVAARVRKETL